MEHFEQVLKYVQQLNRLEVWIVHLLCADKAVENPHWPCEKLQEKGLISGTTRKGVHRFQAF